MDKPNLRDVLGHYGIDLNSSRREVLVRCPVHDEDRPSCSVNEDDGLWNCHACSASGDAFTLIRLKEGLQDAPFGEVISAAERLFGGSYRTEHRGQGRKPARGKGYRPTFKRRPLSG